MTMRKKSNNVAPIVSAAAAGVAIGAAAVALSDKKNRDMAAKLLNGAKAHGTKFFEHAKTTTHGTQRELKSGAREMKKDMDKMVKDTKRPRSISM